VLCSLCGCLPVDVDVWKKRFNVKISYLADHPEFIETLAPWVYEHWRPILTEETLDSRVARLQSHLNRNELPIALVAHSGSNVYGMAALRVHDLPGREDLSPWLGGVFVAQSFRCRVLVRHFVQL
jgi:hypothetical protein